MYRGFLIAAQHYKAEGAHKVYSSINDQIMAALSKYPLLKLHSYSTENGVTVEVSFNEERIVF